ncbi:MAG: ribosome-associated translation inhibitor RaiA [Pseudobutyrivibrio sp.]|nr:ribosome-associated translation inhibitor RaiA [Pseudobutyrivibrio sp.]
MKTTITGKNIELTEGLKVAVEERFKKLDKYFAPDTNANITLDAVKGRQKIEVTIPIKGSTLRAEEVTSDMYASIDAVTNTIEAQLKKHRNKLIDRKQSDSTKIFAQDFIEEKDTEEENIKIVRTKKFDMKPMYPEDACLEMDLVGHDFFMFRNADTDEINVVYKRNNGSYGLIEPEF